MVNVPPGFLELLLCRMVFVTSAEMHKIASLAAGQSPRFRASHRRASPTWLASAGRVHDEVSDGALVVPGCVARWRMRVPCLWRPFSRGAGTRASMSLHSLR